MNKRVLFSEEEKVFVRGMVLENKSVVESKKSDAVSVIEKKKCWDRMTETFNSSGRFPVRTAIQLRKLWENIKTRRKQELAAEKKGRMKTGGGPYTPDVSADPELDAVGVDIELRNAVDSDTVAASNDYGIIEGELYPIEYQEVISTENAEELDPSPDEPIASGSQPLPQIQTTPQSLVQPKKGAKKGKDEAQLRVTRNELLVDNERKLHEARMEESRLRAFLLQQEIVQGAEMFKAKIEETQQRKEIMKVELENVKLKKEILTMEKEQIKKSS